MDWTAPRTTDASDPPATRKGTTTGVAYDAALHRWEVTNAAGRTHNLNWQDDDVIWDRFAMAFDMTQNQDNWASTIYWGSTIDNPGTDNDIRAATGGYAVWIGRPTSVGTEGFDTTGWNVFLRWRVIRWPANRTRSSTCSTARSVEITNPLKAHRQDSPFGPGTLR